MSVAPQKYEAQFTPAPRLPNVALVTFEGNKAVRDTDLQNAIAEVAFGQPYTDANFLLLLDNQIRPLYEKNGYMRVVLRQTHDYPFDDPGEGRGRPCCLSDEGSQYKLGTVGVRGPMEDQSKHILRVAKVPSMGIVNFDELRNADLRVKQALRQEGYLDAEVSTDREINDEKMTVDVYLVPHPGPQYTFGKLELKGLGLDAEAAVKGMWTVKTGDPYPAITPIISPSASRKTAISTIWAMRAPSPTSMPDTHVVDVTLTFVYAPGDRPKKPAEPGQDPNQQQQEPFPRY